MPAFQPPLHSSAVGLTTIVAPGLLCGLGGTGLVGPGAVWLQLSAAGNTTMPTAAMLAIHGCVRRVDFTGDLRSCRTIAHSLHALVSRAVGAAIHLAPRLDAMANDAALAMGTLGRHGVD